jgi:uncharacterized protein
MTTPPPSSSSSPSSPSSPPVPSGASTPLAASAPLMEASAFDELDAILDEMRTRFDETPQWEFCEGFMAALACTRRPIAPAEFLPMLLGTPPPDLPADAAGDDGDSGSFASAAQEQRFLALWSQRWDEVIAALDEQVDTLQDEGCYHPELTDVRGAVAAMPLEERGDIASADVPAFGQVWALGFMYVVESWPEEWDAPRDKDAARWLDESLSAIVALTEDDTGTPEVSPLVDDAPPSTSIARLNALGEAIWAVYDLRELWQAMGPRTAPAQAPATPGRNDACPCGSGKKYKKCCGAG